MLTKPTVKEIEAAYGPVTMRYANGVFVAIVPVMGGIATGFGACATSATEDLFLDLHGEDVRDKLPASGYRLQPWEIEHRQRRADNRNRKG